MLAYASLRKCSGNVDLQVKSFNMLITPILAYASDVWIPYFFQKMEPTSLYSLCDKIKIECINIKFCKFILGVHKRSSNAAVRSELGIFPIAIKLLSQAAKYFFRITSKVSTTSLVYKAYLESYLLSEQKHSSWASGIKKIMHICNYSAVWDNKGTKTPIKFTKCIYETLKSMYIKQWYDILNRVPKNEKDGNKLRNFRLFKTEYTIENYLLGIHCIKQRSLFTKLRIRAHSLPIESGRYLIKTGSTTWVCPLDRKCNKCKSDSPGNEYHFVLECDVLEKERKQLFADICQLYPLFGTLENWDKYIFIMSYNNGDISIAKVVCSFLLETHI